MLLCFTFFLQQQHTLTLYTQKPFQLPFPSSVSINTSDIWHPKRFHPHRCSPNKELRDSVFLTIPIFISTFLRSNNILLALFYLFPCCLRYFLRLPSLSSLLLISILFFSMCLTMRDSIIIHLNLSLLLLFAFYESYFLLCFVESFSTSFRVWRENVLLDGWEKILGCESVWILWTSPSPRFPYCSSIPLSGYC